MHTTPLNFRRFPFLTIAVALAAAATQLCPAFSDIFAYDRDAVMCGQLWRMWSCHLTHWSWNHLWWDTLAFVGLAGFCEIRDRRRWTALMIAAPLAISLVVHYGSPHLAAYRGLSGLDSAFYGLVLAGFIEIRAGRKISPESAVAVLAALAFVAKVAYETATGAAVFAASGGSYIVVPSVHLAGFVAGLAASFAARKTGGQVCLTSRAYTAINM
ncbi:MAG: rhombosortase [Candidatus Sumerlaeia bacterium]